MKYHNYIQRTALLLVLLIAGWAAGCPVSAQTVVEVVPDPLTNLVGTDNSSGTAIQPLDSLNVFDYGVTFSFSKGSGSNYPAFYRNGATLRLYKGNTFTLETTEGSYIVDKVEFQSVAYKSSENTLSANTGTISYDKETLVYTWVNTDTTGNASFTIEDTQLRLTSLRLTFNAGSGIEERPTAPVFSRESGDFYKSFELTITDTNVPAATIRYTLDGSYPSASNGLTYSAPITIPAGSDITVNAVSVNKNGTSLVTSATYHFAVLKAPMFSHESRDFYKSFDLTISDINEPPATIRYTLDGSTPSAENGLTYLAPITIPTGSDVTVNAVSVNENGTSPVTSATYHFIPSHLFSVRITNKNGINYLYYSSDNEYGEWYDDNSTYIPEGAPVYVGCNFRTGYRCKGVTLNGVAQTLSNNSFEFVMPSSAAEVVIDVEFNPSSPADPQPADSTKKYNLTLVCNPSGAASLRGSGVYKAGSTVYVSADVRSGYVFRCWTKDGETVSTSSQYTFTMPAYDAVLVANYVYNPSNPSDPQQPTLKHPLTVIASPSGAGTFSTTSSEVTFGEEYHVYAYPRSGYKFKGWIVNGVAQTETSSHYTGVMTDAGAQVVGLFIFDPASPSNPGANYYNPTTGQVIIDDFTPGYLYDALRDVIGTSDYSNVSSLIVKGKISSNDYGTLSYLNNAVTIDLSRTGGVTSVPGYAFQELAVGNILLPSSTTSIGNYAFSNCANLTALTVYAQEPPRCSSYTFSGLTNKDNCTVFVPETALELYTSADYWKNFTILPITDDAHVLQVNLPADAFDGRYKNNSIELVNLNSGVRQKYVISDRLLYTFNGLRKDEQYNIYMLSQAGLELGRIENVTVPDNDFEVTFDNLKSVYNVKAVVTTPGGEDVTSDATVEWLKPLADGTTSYLRSAVSLGEIPEGQALICHVTLNNRLGMIYAMPEDTEFTVSAEQTTCTVSLVPFRSIAISGTVVDGDGVALPEASVSVNQMLNGKFSKSYTTKTDAQGQWSLSVLDAPETYLTYAAIECVNVNDTIGAFEPEVSTLDLGNTMLKSIVGARVTYGFTYHAAGVEEVEDSYSDYQNVAVSVFNVTQNREHKEVSLQYPIIAVLDENINVGDELKLTATSKTGAFNPIEKTVTIGEDERAEVTFDIVGKGGISASFEMSDNPAVIAMLYSSHGELLKNQTYAEDQTTFTELDDGDYTLVTMGQSDLMNSILRLANFSEIGLTEGKDYVKNAVKVESGKLAEVRNSEIPAFDESLFYYTNSSTSFSSNKSSITTGNYLTLRSAIDFKGVYKNDISNVALVVDLPEACDFVEQSVIQGPNLLPYTLDNNRLIVQLGNNYTSQVRFCAIPTKGGSFNATASIVFDYKGKTLTQPIGTANAHIKDIEISVSKIVAKPFVKVIGVAQPKSKVNLYWNNVIYSQTVANRAGEWSAELVFDSLTQNEVYSVFAEIITDNGQKLLTETKTVTYNERAAIVKSVTMINQAHPATSLDLCDYVTVFDFESLATPKTYWYWPSFPDFTFMVDIECNSPELIPLVWVNVFTSDDKVRSLLASYDENLNKWICKSQFLSGGLPKNVSVSIEDMVYSLNDEATYQIISDEYVGDFTLKDASIDDDGTEHATYIDGQGKDLMELTSYDTERSENEIIEELKNQGFELDEEMNNDDDYVPEDESDVLTDKVTVLTDSVSGSLAFIHEPQTPVLHTIVRRVVIVKVIREQVDSVKIDTICSIITNEWKRFHKQYFDNLTCEQVTAFIKYTEHLDKYVKTIYSSKWAKRVFVDYRFLPPGTKVPKKELICKIRRLIHSCKTYTTHTMEYSRVPSSCPPPPPAPPTPPTPDGDYVMDPSGFVYEAVPVNRVEGVQATIYYKETKEDMYGDPYEEIAIWNAEEYAQKNPLFTDENGMYQWDVPQGLWQVKFEKDGYVTAYSEWLPVPPPQLEVNIGIVQNKQPEVTEARAYEEGVEVQFDKYMDLSTLTTDNIYVTANGEKLAGEIRLIDSALADEYADEEDADATRYASRVRFVPEQPLSITTGEVRVTVSRNVLSYAGIPMTETFSQVLDVEKEVQIITADDVKVLYGGEKEVTVYALPYDAAVGRTLRIANSSDLITSIDKTEAVLDEEGKATVIVKGDLPGRAQLTFTIDDVTATGECAVDVVTEIITAEAPKSSRASGTAVYRGTKIELTSESKNATIYFTTDGSCPCDENGTRRKYTVPIIINEDTKILAMTSVGTGDDDVSETVEFNYTLKRSDMEFAMEEGWTWISHNFDAPVAAETLAADENIHRIMSQTQEVIRDPQLGMVGTLTELSASESYKVETSASTALHRLSDIAWNPATPIALNSGWNWLGYPVSQTMSVDEAFAMTAAETLDIVVGQNGFAQFDGEKWVGTLETMSPGMGYMYQSQSAKNVVYNTSIVSTASAKYVPGISGNSPLVLDIHKYGMIMPVVATLTNTDGSHLDNEDYQIAAFCGTECRGIGRVVNGLVMMNVYGNVTDNITFQVTDADGEISFSNDASLKFSETVVGDIFNPYAITINNLSGINEVKYDGNIKVTVEGDMLRIKGIAASDIDLVEIFDIDGHKLIRETNISESGIRISTLTNGVYVVIVKGNGEYSYHKIAVR